MTAIERQELLGALRESPGGVLATVVWVRGSAYRREGAKMLVRPDATTVCSLSGGCLEPDVAQRALEVMRTGRPLRVAYDLEEDAVWGLGLGCGGSVEVYLEPLADPLLLAFLESLEGDGPSLLATPLSGGEGRLLFREGRWQGKIRPQALEARVRAEAERLLLQAHPRAKRLDLEEAQVFLDPHAPPLELVLFGGGHDAIPLAALGRRYGFKVTVVDPRAAYVHEGSFPGCRLVLAHPEGLPEGLLTERSYAVIMNHHLERDRKTLAYALRSAAPYVGVLGPRDRFHKLRDALEAEGFPFTPEVLQRIHNPVGLDIGAEGPEEIALSVLAEILAASRGYGGGPLRERPGKIHKG
ncbi:XdhC family protein [Thermus thermamylovorans]|uniref:XdhC family protein n=1 Tax=Thermus thermamylovorans TaxID=2509362 RepID=A0A4Q9B774_9DEIN|nr:XdhC family protein [Thermus thermamylovorans]TBH20952.1 XdhC family protein [Thermus thermamylovorans]